MLDVFVSLRFRILLVRNMLIRINWILLEFAFIQLVILLREFVFRNGFKLLFVYANII